jgi:hypothetical protein
VATPSKRIARRLPVDPEAEAGQPNVPRIPETNGDDEPDPTAYKPGQGLLKSGWGPGQKQMDSTSSWAQTFRPDEKIQVIKFLEDSPYASLRRHWVDRTLVDDQNKTVKTRRPYTCLLSFDKDPKGNPSVCPLCEVGEKPQATSCFNIALCDDKGNVERKSWDVGARLFNVLKAYANDPKIAPLTRGYFLVSKTGKMGTVQYNVLPVKASALEEDYDTPVPAQADLDALELYTDAIIEVPTVKALRELANELMDDYE